MRGCEDLVSIVPQSTQLRSRRNGDGDAHAISDVGKRSVAEDVSESVTSSTVHTGSVIGGHEGLSNNRRSSWMAHGGGIECHGQNGSSTRRKQWNARKSAASANVNASQRE